MGDYKSTRKITRHELHADIKLKIHESSKKDVRLLKDYIEAKTSEISEKGLGICAAIYLPEGTCLEIEVDSSPFGLDQKGPIYIVGRVTSCVMAEVGYRIGIRFSEISDSDRTVIKNYIQLK